MSYASFLAQSRCPPRTVRACPGRDPGSPVPPAASPPSMTGESAILFVKLMGVVSLALRIRLALPPPRERPLGLQPPDEPLQDEALLALIDPDTAPWSFERPPARHPIFSVDIDRCWEHTGHLSQADRLLYQECALVDGKVVGFHEAVVVTPWYLTAEYLRKRLTSSPQQAATLADSFAILDATPAMVETFLDWLTVRGVEAGMPYFTALAQAAAEAETVDPADALHHAAMWEQIDAPQEVGMGLTPELALLLAEGVPSAALIAHRCGLSLAQAGEVREALLLQCFAEAAQAAQPIAAGADDAESDDALNLAEEVESVAPPTLHWHLLDEEDPETPWLARQPLRYQQRIREVRRCEDLTTLKALGKAVYEERTLHGSQAGVFWTEYELRKDALIRELARPTRLSPVAQCFLARIRTATNVPAIGRWLYRTQTAQVPGGPQPAEWTVLWTAYQAVKGAPPAERSPLSQSVSA